MEGAAKDLPEPQPQQPSAEQLGNSECSSPVPAESSGSSDSAAPDLANEGPDIVLASKNCSDQDCVICYESLEAFPQEALPCGVIPPCMFLFLLPSLCHFISHAHSSYYQLLRFGSC